MTDHEHTPEAGLLPCPFCRGRGSILSHSVQCSDCGALISSRAGFEQAIAAWNRRSAPTFAAPEAGIASITGPELWEILFSVFEGDVPKALTDAKLTEVATAIRSAFGPAHTFAAGVEADYRDKALAVFTQWAIDVSTLGELADLGARMAAVGVSMQRVGEFVPSPAAEPSEAEVEAAARAMCRRILLVSYDENRVDAIVDVRWRGWENYARVALIAAAHARASRQGGK